MQLLVAIGRPLFVTARNCACICVCMCVCVCVCMFVVWLYVHFEWWWAELVFDQNLWPFYKTLFEKLYLFSQYWLTHFVVSWKHSSTGCICFHCMVKGFIICSSVSICETILQLKYGSCCIEILKKVTIVKWISHSGTHLMWTHMWHSQCVQIRGVYSFAIACRVHITKNVLISRVSTRRNSNVQFVDD